MVVRGSNRESIERESKLDTLDPMTLFLFAFWQLTFFAFSLTAAFSGSTFLSMPFSLEVDQEGRDLVGTHNNNIVHATTMTAPQKIYRQRRQQRWRRQAGAAVGVVLLMMGIAYKTFGKQTTNTESFTLTSPAFAYGQAIPVQYARDDGDNTPPPLTWQGAPSGTRSFALIVDDPDAPDPVAPQTVWVHWVVYNIGPTTTSVPLTASHGLNDWNVAQYDGPAPPIGRHRYFFKLHALDTVLHDLGPSATKATLEQAMQGHILGTATLMGTYQKKGG